MLQGDRTLKTSKNCPCCRCSCGGKWVGDQWDFLLWIKVGLESRRQKTARDESWAAQIILNSDEPICSRHQGPEVLTLYGVHSPSITPTSVSVSWDTHTVPRLSPSFFLCPFCPSSALRHKMYGSVPPCVSNCKIKIVLVLAYLDSFQANHICYVSVHLFAPWCTMSVRGSWMQNNTNTNRVRKIWDNRTMWRAGIKPTRSGI